MEKVIVKTKQGRVSGQRFGRFVEFKGIPYGKAERFCEAVMYQWEGVLDCTEFGKKALQFPAPLPQLPEPEPEEHFGEDCLNLNIYTPDISRSLPVLVDIHGGAFQNGSNRDHTPDKMTEDKDIVYVNLNYRLGVFGYLYLGQILEKSTGRAVVGSCRNELGFYKLRDPEFLDHAPSVADGLFGINAETAKEDHEKLCRDVICEKGICDEEKKKEIWIKIFSDYMYRTYSERMAKILMRNGSTVYKYSMEYAPALHCQDQSFAFETKDGGEMYRDGSTLEEKNRLGRTIFEAYTNFIRTGDPNGAGVPYWSEYREGGFLQMNWDAVSGEAPEEADDTLKRFPEQVYRLR